MSEPSDHHQSTDAPEAARPRRSELSAKQRRRRRQAAGTPRSRADRRHGFRDAQAGAGEVAADTFVPARPAAATAPTEPVTGDAPREPAAVPAPAEPHGPSPAEVALDDATLDEATEGTDERDHVPVPARERRESRLRGRLPGRDGGRRTPPRTAVLLGVLGVVAVVAAAVVFGFLDRARELVAPDEVGEVAAETVTDAQPSIVLVTFDETDPSGSATGLAVLAHDRDTGRGTVLLVPVATVTDVPGYGSFQLSEAHAFGQGALVAVTLDNLLGVRFDGLARLSEQGWAALLTRVDGFEVDVRSRLVDRSEGAGEARFEPGPQFLDGPRLAEYLTFRDDTETELETLPRVQQVVLGLLDRIAEEPAVLDRLFDDGAPMVDTTDTELLRTVLRELAEARSEDQVTTLTLPVTTLGSGRDDLYRIDAARVGQLVEERLAASRPEEGAGAGRSVQILNGNGVPLVGQLVAERLSEGGYRIVLTGNADRFDYPVTKIVIYGESDEQLAIARDLQQRLGVGEIERSGTPQSVVDVTIVVGADFPPAN